MKEYKTYQGWKRACKKVCPNCFFEGDKDIAQCLVSIEGKKGVVGIGEWDGEKGEVFNTEYIK